MSTDPGGAHSTHARLLELATSADSPEEFARELLEITITGSAASDPELPELIRRCAIPRRFDAEVLGSLRGQPDDSAGNQRLLEAIAAHAFVTERRDGSFSYNTETREALLARWRDDRADELRQLNESLAQLHEARNRKADELERDFETVAPLIREASPPRYLQVDGILDTQVMTPLLEAFYHSAAVTPHAGYAFFTRYFQTYEQAGRLSVCAALAESAREIFEPLPAGQERSELLGWLEYWRARLLRAQGQVGAAKHSLEDLLPRAATDTKLTLWALGELGIAHEMCSELEQAGERYRAAVELSEQTEVDRYNLPLAHLRLARLESALQRPREALPHAQRAVELARLEANVEIEASARVQVSNELLQAGRWDDAFTEALRALHLARTALPSARALARNISEQFMSLAAGRDPALFEASFAEARALLPGREPSDDSTIGLELRRADLLLDTGQLRRCDALLTDLRGRVVDGTALAAQYRLAEASLLGAQGRLEESMAVFRLAIDQSEGDPGAAWVNAASISNLAARLAEVGRLDESLALLRDASARWKTIGHGTVRSLVRVFEADGLRRLGRLDDAAELLAEIRDSVLAMPSRYAVYYHRISAELVRSRGRFQEAETAFRDAAAAALSFRGLREATIAYDSLAELAGRQGQWALARGYADAAAGLFAELDALEEYEPEESERQATDENAQALVDFTTANDERPVIGRARDNWRSASRRAPTNPWYALNLSYGCAALGDWDEASKALALVIESDAPWAQSPALGELFIDFRLR